MPYNDLAGPSVTAVGGRWRYDPEEAADLSGGGFSDYFPREDYQDKVVTTYLQNLGDQYMGSYKYVCCCDQSRPLLIS